LHLSDLSDFSRIKVLKNYEIQYTTFHHGLPFGATFLKVALKVAFVRFVRFFKNQSLEKL
jgi:hypothetical protein